MEVKYCLILLLALAASRRGDCFEFERVTHFIDKNEETYSVFVVNFKNTDEVGWYVCGKLPGFTDAGDVGQFVCSRLADFTNISRQRYIGCVTHFTSTEETAWLVRITVVDFKHNDEKGWFLCKRLLESGKGSYFVFVKHFSKPNEAGWFACQSIEHHNYQCSGGDYCGN